MIKFIFNNKPYCTPNKESLPKKLKKLGASFEDILILEDTFNKEEKVELDTSIKLHRFNNIKDGRYIIGVCDNLNHLVWNPDTKTGIKDFNINDWQRIEE